MNNKKIDVIATSISGSISDWGKVKHIVPLFNKFGFENVTLYTTDSHNEARQKTKECVDAGTKTVISAGGSGTFNAVLEGLCDSGVSLSELNLGFLRKGSADLIGKVLGMPDEIEAAIKVFADSINNNTTIKCDVIQAESLQSDQKSRRFVGYGGAEIFGGIPYYTENRYIKYYKGMLSQLFGDLGPFFVGATLSSIEKSYKSLLRGTKTWSIHVDGKKVSENYYRAMIIVNGDLGKDLPLAKNVPLGSGDFYLLALRDIGLTQLPGQFRSTWNASVDNDPEQWGFEKYQIKKSLKLCYHDTVSFPVNIDGSTMNCLESVEFRIIDQVNLISSE